MDLEELAKSELIGLNVKVMGKKINGRIIDETKNGILIETKKGNRKMILKNNNKFEFFLDERIVIDGKKLAFRPDERIKRMVNL